MHDNVRTVNAIYEAFGRGDIAGILEHFDEEVVLDAGALDHGVPYLRERNGKEEAAAFFGDLAANFEFTLFEPLARCAGGDHVAVPVRQAGRVVGGDVVAPFTTVHLWRFGADGRVVEMSHQFDFARHERAFAGRAAPLTGATFQVLADQVQVDHAGGRFELFVVTGEAESGPPPHAHPWDEAYLGLEGHVEVTIGDHTTTIGPGDVAVAPAGTLHCYRVASERARFRVVTSGHRASQFFADMSRNAAPGLPTPESLPVIIDIARRNGLSSPLFA